MSKETISAILSLTSLTSPIAAPPRDLWPQAQETKIVSSRSSLRRMQSQLAMATTLQPIGKHVGELQEKWQFPSDHLPIGMTYEGQHFLSWNVLNTAYMRWITENSQGLSRSMIVDENIPIDNTKLTIRDVHIADMICEAVTHPTHPRSVLSLQECSSDFLRVLREKLPAHFQIVQNHGDAVVIDTRQFAVVEAKEVAGVFAHDPQRVFQDLTIRRIDNGQIMRLINIHLPGDPTKPGRFEFAKYIAETFDPQMPMLAMGDMNFNEVEMNDALREAFAYESPFSIYSPYCTNISPGSLDSKAIDHFISYLPVGAKIALNAPEEIFDGLKPIVDLID